MQSKSDRLDAIEKLLSEHPEGLNAREIADVLNIQRSTVTRYLTSLGEYLPLWENRHGRIGIFRSADLSLEQLIQLGESNRLEFKQTACWNPHRKVKEQSLVENIGKSIAGFMNSKLDGIILIGVTNDGQIIGLDNDLKVADGSKPNKDGYELFLRNAINSCIGCLTDKSNVKTN